MQLWKGHSLNFLCIYLFYGSAVAPIDNYIVQYAFFSLCVVAGMMALITCLAFFPTKLLVFDDHLRIKYRAYRSRRIGLREVESMTASIDMLL